MFVKALLHDERGAVMVEVAILSTIMFIVVLGGIDLLFSFYQWNAAAKAVQVGARCRGPVLGEQDVFDERRNLSVLLEFPATIAALGWRAHGWNAITTAQALSALELTLVASLVVALINAVAGTAIAWTLVRDRFLGQGAVNALVDLPFALPTIVAGLTLLALYGPRSPAGVDLAFTRWAILLALLVVTLPFVVRTVQSVLLELGYLSNKQDAKLLMSDAWRGHATDAVMTAIDSFFAAKQRDIRATSN